MTDEWSNFADLLANLIAKYASVIDIDSLPDPVETDHSDEMENIDDIRANSDELEVENMQVA